LIAVDNDIAVVDDGVAKKTLLLLLMMLLFQSQLQMLLKGHFYCC
jgi:hypothetical protein